MTTLERITRRILGAVRFIGSTTHTPITEALILSSPSVTFIRNRRSVYVIEEVSNLELHSDSFLTPPASPPIGSVTIELTVSDPRGRYLPRRRVLQLPRNPQPSAADQPDSLFRVIDVPLYPAPTAKTSHNWVSIYVGVTRDGAGTPLAGALLRVTRSSDSQLLARGLTDRRGEALIAVSGIPVTTWDEGTTTVLTTEVPVTLEAIVDPDGGAIADPDDLEARKDTLPSHSMNLLVAAGRRLAVNIAVPVP